MTSNKWQWGSGNTTKKKKKKHISGEHQVLLLVEQDYQEQEGNLKPDTGVKKGTGEDNETQEKTKMWRNGGKTRSKNKNKTHEKPM